MIERLCIPSKFCLSNCRFLFSVEINICDLRKEKKNSNICSWPDQRRDLLAQLTVQGEPATNGELQVC